MLKRKIESNTKSNATPQDNDITLTIIAGHARQGKTYLMEAMFAADPDPKKVYTLAHKNKIKVADEIYKRFITITNLLDLHDHFQPPKVLCVAKRQGTDFPNVNLIVTGDDYKAVTKNGMDTTCRATAFKKACKLG
jgi:hypothetical protein